MAGIPAGLSDYGCPVRTIMVVMMIFRPQGIFTNIRRNYESTLPETERREPGAPAVRGHEAILETKKPDMNFGRASRPSTEWTEVVREKSAP
jgi:hypothetical protein